MKDTLVETDPKVLIVDDEENILRALKRLLVNEDIDVIVTNSGEKGLEILKNTDNIGVIISDQRMPGLTGVDFLERARMIAPDTIRIILTGYADINAAIDAINRGGAFRYITKPWKDEELVHIIKEALRHYNLIIENKRLNKIIKQQNEELKKWNSQLEYFVQEQTLEIQKKNEELKKLNARLRSNFKNTIFAFSRLLEMRDRGWENHSRNVTEISVRVAKALELSKKETEDIMVASLLHDIGKIAIPDMLIQKDVSEMSPEEFNIYKQHPVRGQAAIDIIEDLRDAGVLIRHHHEHYNGGGFPDGLKGEAIPLGARIISIADFIDREIQKHNVDNALELTFKELKKQLGTVYDPKLFEHIVAPSRTVYAERLPKTDVIELELSPQELRPGMIISRDVHSGTGLLLLRKGTKLDEKNIAALRRYYQIDPSKSGVFVWIKRRA